MRGLSRLVISAVVSTFWFAVPVHARTEAAIVVDAASGRVLHARRADSRIYPASLTKMMTLYLLFEAIEEGRHGLDDTLPVSRRAAGMPASRLGLERGQRIRVEDAIRALIVKSANDVAVVVAEALGGTESKFARLMTEKARALGMSRTTFVNASGLPNARQRTTVRDLALLARRLISDFPGYYHYFGEKSFRWHGRRYRTHNGLLGRYAGADGLETGYIRASGYNLAASAERGGRRVIAVYVGGRSAPRRDRKVARLLDLGFERLSPPALVALGPPLPRPAGVVRVAAAPTPSAWVDPGAPRPVARPVAAVSRDDPEITAPRRPPRTRQPSSAPVDAAWGVQVGAFLRPADAYRAARDAVRSFPDLLLDGAVEVSPRRGRRKVFYRARIAGFDRRQAEEICELLERRERDCLVVRYGEPVTVAAR